MVCSSSKLINGDTRDSTGNRHPHHCQKGCQHYCQKDHQKGRQRFAGISLCRRRQLRPTTFISSLSSFLPSSLQRGDTSSRRHRRTTMVYAWSVPCALSVFGCRVSGSDISRRDVGLLVCNIPRTPVFTTLPLKKCNIETIFHFIFWVVLTAVFAVGRRRSWHKVVKAGV